MKALVIVAHGSRREASNQEVRELSLALSEKLGDAYGVVNTGFLELAEPLIPESIIECIEQGADKVSVLPYFLSAGRHVQEDVPADVDKVRVQYPEVEIELLPYLGAIPGLLDLLATNLTSA